MIFSRHFARYLALLFLLAAPLLDAAGAATPNPKQAYLPPAFPDDAREQRVRSLASAVDKAYRDYATEKHLPGVAYGIVLDGRLIHAGAVGSANLQAKIPASPATRFRIASMTKSFTALAVLKLRDEGKLALQDPAEKYLPHLGAIPRLTADSPPVTLRNLLTMTAGFPEDNPWGDRQLADSVEELKAFVQGGISLSNAPGQSWEYSNLGFALLGQVISHVSGLPYQQYITREILLPLRMTRTSWEFSEVPATELALGYRWENETWKEEPLLHDGTYGAMGGLITTIEDFSRYVAFHQSAYPARNDPEDGPIRRSTLREMHRPAEISALLGDAKSWDGQPLPAVRGYGYGLRWSLDSREVVRVSHTGGLPGFGSEYSFCPDYGIAVISFANLTYAPMSAINAKVLGLILDTAHLPARTLPVSAILQERQKQVVQLLATWDNALGETILAENFYADRSRDSWIAFSRKTLESSGKILAVTPLVPRNQLRGSFTLQCEKANVMVTFTLTPESPPRIQQLVLNSAAKSPAP